MNGFIKVAAAASRVTIGNCGENVKRIETIIRKAEKIGVQVIVFPELSVTGYTCMDLFEQQSLLESAKKCLHKLIENTETLGITAIVGMPLEIDNRLMDVAVVFQKGRILGIVPKTFIPNSRESLEMRMFASAGQLQSDYVEIDGNNCPVGNDLIFQSGKTLIGIEIGEDLMATVPQSSRLALQGANVIFNLSANCETAGKNKYMEKLISSQSARCIAGYIYASAGFGESSTDLVFTGKCMIAENGTIMGKTERFSMDDKFVENDIDIDYLQHDRRRNVDYVPNVQPGRRISFELAKYTGTLSREINPHPFVPSDEKNRNERCEEIFNIQTFGLIRRLEHIHVQSAVIGVSGGLDSTLALMVTVNAFDTMKIPRENIIGITMPGFGTTARTYKNAVNLIKSLGLTFKEISIKKACKQHFKDIEHDGQTPDTTYENSQARERTQILMDIANMKNGIVVGTGDLSELALGWATYNGDHMSMYDVNGDVPKTLIRYIIEWYANASKDKKIRKTLLDIAATPISPELMPANDNGTIKQKTEDIVGPYELHDFFLYHFIRFGASPEKILFLAEQAFKNSYPSTTIKKWLQIFLRRFFSQQFKRSCLPDGPKVGSVDLSPRGEWQMPSDADSMEWIMTIGNK